MWCSQAVSGPAVPSQAAQHQSKRFRWTACRAAPPAAVAGPLGGGLQFATAAAAAVLLLAAAPQVQSIDASAFLSRSLRPADAALIKPDAPSLCIQPMLH